MAEFLVKLFKLAERTLEAQYATFFKNRDLIVIPVNRRSAVAASELRARFNLRLADAPHSQLQSK